MLVLAKILTFCLLIFATAFLLTGLFPDAKFKTDSEVSVKKDNSVETTFQIAFRIAFNIAVFLFGVALVAIVTFIAVRVARCL